MRNCPWRWKHCWTRSGQTANALCRLTSLWYLLAGTGYRYKFFLNVIYQNSRLTQVFLQEDFELGLGTMQPGFSPNLLLILLPSVESSPFEKSSGKKNLIAVSRPGLGKILFALLDVVITIKGQLTLINVGGPGFKNPLWELLGFSRILVIS